MRRVKSSLSAKSAAACFSLCVPLSLISPVVLAPVRTTSMVSVISVMASSTAVTVMSALAVVSPAAGCTVAGEE